MSPHERILILAKLHQFLAVEKIKTHTFLFAHLFEGVPLAKMIDDFEV